MGRSRRTRPNPAAALVTRKSQTAADDVGSDDDDPAAIGVRLGTQTDQRFLDAHTQLDAEHPGRLVNQRPIVIEIGPQTRRPRWIFARIRRHQQVSDDLGDLEDPIEPLGAETTSPVTVQGVSGRRRRAGSNRQPAAGPSEHMLRAELSVLADDVLRLEPQVTLQEAARDDFEAAIHRYRVAQVALGRSR